MLNNKIIMLLYFMYSSILTSQFYNEPYQQKCLNYYSPSYQLPAQCNPQTKICDFRSGIGHLLTNISYDITFILCLNLPDYTVHIKYNQNSTQVQGANSTYIEIISSVYINSFEISFQYYQLLAPSGIQIQANSTIQFTNTTIQSYKIWIQSQENIIITGSVFKNQSLLQTKCNCYKLLQQCDDWDFKYPNFFPQNDNSSFNIEEINQLDYESVVPNSITIVANNSTSLKQASKILISIVGIFAEQIQINNSKISTDGQGFPSGFGSGCGYFDQVLHQLLNCMGTGGSHGGLGGNSSPQNCYLLMSKIPYGSVEYPYAPGSGGGFFIPQSKESSSGGGIINIQTQSLTLSNSIISATGKNGTQGGGGGAGGAIYIDYQNLNTSGLNLISADGGNGSKSSSGGGGRIRIYNHDWKKQNSTNSNKSLVITANGGPICPGKLSCGEDGSIFTSPCPPGNQLVSPYFVCQPCGDGSFQLTYGYSKCISCGPLPKNAQWNSSTNYSQSLTSSNFCQYTCSTDYYKQSGTGKCLTQSEINFNKIGGQNLLISIGIVIFAIILYALIILCKKISINEQFAIDVTSSNDKFFEKKYFRMQDIPFHELRLYINGSNNPFDPWYLSKTTQQKICSQLKNPLTKISKVLAKVIQQINQQSGYTRIQKSIIVILKYTYYPLSQLILKNLQSKKVQKISNAISKVNKRSPDFQNVGMKFHIKPQLTVCSLQLFNYTRSVLDFYIENYYPLYFLLQKAPFGGYSLDFTDPFLKVFINQIGEKDPANAKFLEKFLNKTNNYLKNPTQLITLLSHLWSLKNHFPHLQAYLWQPPNHVFGQDKQYKIDRTKPLFLSINNQQMNNRHFIFNESLPCIYHTEIQYLKHKFAIRKQATNQEQKSSLWIMPNQISEKKLLISLGVLSIINLGLALASLTLLITLFTFNQSNMKYGLIIYFLLWPLSDFCSVFFNFKTLLNKDQQKLALAIKFTIVTIIKMTILFFCILVQSLNDQNQVYFPNMFIWLAMVLISLVIFLVQIMLRAKIIQDKK